MSHIGIPGTCQRDRQLDLVVSFAYHIAKDMSKVEELELLQEREVSLCVTTRSPPSCSMGKHMAKVANIPGVFSVSLCGLKCAPSWYTNIL